MQSYLSNVISIAPEDVPADVALGETARVVSPSTRGGVAVTFEAAVIRAFTGLLRVQQGDKEIVPSYGEITVETPAGPFTSPLNGEGYFYLENVPPGQHDARIGYGGGQACAFTIQIPSTSATTVDLGALTCRRTE
jgi:outer membrane usher protein FimD/PapC